MGLFANKAPIYLNFRLLTKKKTTWIANVKKVGKAPSKMQLPIDLERHQKRNARVSLHY
jgi:hypothetical protein